MIKATWRRKIGAGAAIGALVLTTGWTGAQAQDQLPGVVDIAVSVDQEIQTVTWDQWARADWDVANVGVEPSTSSTLTVNLPAGSVLKNSPAGCEPSGATVTCQIGALAPGNSTTEPVTSVLLPGVSSQTITMYYDVPDVAGQVSAVATLQNNSTLAALDLGGNTLEYTPNNTATATTNVIAPGGTSSGWIPPCGTMSTGVHAVDGRVGTLANGVRRADGSCTRTVPLGVVELEFVEAEGDEECTPGTPGSCGNGFSKTFTAETEQNLTSLAPAKWTISYGLDAKCAGTGFPAGCPGAQTYYFEDADDNTAEDPGQCPGSSSGGGGGVGVSDGDGYCVNRRFKVNQQIYIELLIDHNGFDLGGILR